MRKALAVAEFDRTESSTKTFSVRFHDLDELITFAASFGWCERELREMTPDRRKDFDAELASRLQPLTTSEGIEDTWTLNFFVAHRD